MEAIKFSELPSGDKQDLGENDGLPIIANQENRLLSWGRLKKQLAKQTHTDDDKLNDENKEKVPTMLALENRISGVYDDIKEQTDELEKQIGEAKTEATNANNTATSASVTANTAKATAEGALEQAGTAQTAANSAQNVALNAKSSAETFYSELNSKLDTNTTALQSLRGDLEAEATARTEAVANVNSSVQNVASRVGVIETKIASGELGGGNGTGDGNDAPSVDLTPVNNRLTALESKDTEHENRLEALETAKTTQASKIATLETSTANLSDTLASQATQINELKTSTSITDAEGNVTSVADAIGEVRQASADAGAVANAAKTLAETAQTQSVLSKNQLVTQLLFCNSMPNDLPGDLEAASDVETERLANTFIDAFATETPNISWLTTILNANFYRITEVINAISADLAEAGGDPLEKTLTIEKGVYLDDSLLDENGEYAGTAYFTPSYNYEVIDGHEVSIGNAISYLYHNQAIMFAMLKFMIRELSVRKGDMDTVVKNINSVLAQVMN